MCNQTVSLVAAELERQGITTVVLQLLKFVAEKVHPPRALFVPFPHGYPLDQPNQPDPQKHVLRQALSLLEKKEARPPLLADYSPTTNS